MDRHDFCHTVKNNHSKHQKTNSSKWSAALFTRAYCLVLQQNLLHHHCKSIKQQHKPLYKQTQLSETTNFGVYAYRSPYSASNAWIHQFIFLIVNNEMETIKNIIQCYYLQRCQLPRQRDLEHAKLEVAPPFFSMPQPTKPTSNN